MANEQFYSTDDFKKVRKVDAHVHYNTHATDITSLAQSLGFRLLSINTNIPGFPSIEQQQEYILKHRAYKQTLFHLTTFDSINVYDDDWVSNQLQYVRDAIRNGALGFKVWKDIGMVLQDAKGEFVFIDDKMFRPFFDFAEAAQLPVLAHIGEPKNCWLPLDEMTVNNDRNYFTQHPEYHMALHPECPSYDTLMQSYQNMLDQHPSLTYIGAHFASFEWSIEKVGELLDKYPLMAVDTAERMGHMHFQTIADREAVRQFFIKYQDRILYGTDIIVDDGADMKALSERATSIWQNDWRYLTTDDELTSPYVNESFRGLKLPVDVVDKVYSGNATKWYKMP
ncbi:MAG: hydrolase [Chitinophagaceae bacterium]|nr:MAG: hydrolase [Chitinophagaceae bacterium]